MSGETEDNISGWTVDTLHSHIDSLLHTRDRVTQERVDGIMRLLAEMDLRYQQRFEAQNKALEAALLAAEKAVRTALEAAKEAVLKAEVANERRLEGLNEFRAQLSDQAQTFMPRSEHDVEMSSVGDQISRVEQAMAGRVSQVEQTVNTRLTNVEDMVKTLQIWQGNISGRIAVYGAVFTVLMAAIVFIANYITRA